MPPKSSHQLASKWVKLLAPTPSRGGPGYNGFRKDYAEQMSVGIGSGVWGLGSGVRSFGGSIKSRLGGTIIQETIPTNCTRAIDFWSGTLNGIFYLVVAYADNSNNTRLYCALSLEGLQTNGWNNGGNQSFNALTPSTYNVEVTESAGYMGNTRFSSVATDLAWGVMSYSYGNYDYTGNAQKSHEVLVISDGSTVRVFDPFYSSSINLKSTLWKHADVASATDLSKFTQVATFLTYTQVARTSGARTFYAARGTTQAVTYACSDTTAAPYNSGSNYCVLLTENVAPVGNFAGFPFASAKLFSTDFSAQLVMVLEGASATITDFIQNTRISGSPNTVNMVLITSSTNTVVPNPIVVTTAVNHGLTSGDEVTIVGHTLNTNANGSHYANVISPTTFGLYDTAAHAIAGGTTGAISGTGGAAGGATGTVHANFVTIYDPTTSDDTYNNPVYTSPLDNGSVNRTYIVFDLNHLTTAAQGNPEQRSFGYLRFERIQQASAAGLSLTILAVAAGGPLPGGTEFAISWTNPYAYTEGPGYFLPQGVTTAAISTFGGPSVVTSSTSVIAPNLPGINSAVFYDFKWTLTNPWPGSTAANAVDGATVAANPVAVNFYMKAAGDPAGDYSFIYNYAVLTKGTYNGWTRRNGGATFTVDTSITPFSDYDANSRTVGITVPTSFQRSIPPSFCYGNAYGRMFAGRPYATSGSISNSNQVWISQKDLQNRWQTQPRDIDGIINDDYGTRCILAGTVQAIVGNTDSDGENEIYVLTNYGCWLLGNLATTGTTYTAGRLSTPTFVSNHGTLSPKSAVNSLGAIVYFDQFGDIVEVQNGSVRNISLRAVSDLVAEVPSGLIGDVVGESLGKRYYFGHAIPGATTNGNVLVRDTVADNWEADDELPATWDVIRWRRVFDSSFPGTGQRLIGITASGKIYCYDESTTGDFGGSYVNCSLTTGIYWDLAGRTYFGDVAVWGECELGQVMTISRFSLETGACHQTQLDIYNPFNSSATHFAMRETPAQDPSEIPNLMTFTVATYSVAGGVITVNPNAAVTIPGAVGSTPRALAQGDLVLISQVVSNVGASVLNSGPYYAKPVPSTNNFDLYTDAACTTPVTPDGNTYVSGGTIAVITAKGQMFYRGYIRYDWPYAPGKQIDMMSQEIVNLDSEPSIAGVM